MLQNFVIIFLTGRVLVNNITGFWREELEIFARLKKIFRANRAEKTETHTFSISLTLSGIINIMTS
jgi:hypothetical protein